MKRKKTITVGDLEITALELTVAQVRDLMEEFSTVKPNIMDLLFPDNLPSIVISESTGISIQKLEEGFSPSELHQIIEAVETLNPFFVNMMTRLKTLGQGLLKEKKNVNLLKESAVN